MLQLVVQLPIVFLLCWLFFLSIPFVPPMKQESYLSSVIIPSRLHCM
jgi:hypothetical protein